MDIPDNALILILLLVMALAGLSLFFRHRLMKTAERMDRTRQEHERAMLELSHFAQQMEGQRERMDLMERHHRGELQALRTALSGEKERSVAVLTAEKEKVVEVLNARTEKELGVMKAETEKALGVLKAEKEKELDELTRRARKDAVDRSRAVLKGKIGEQMAPLLEEFHIKYDLADARFIGDPIDYIIFRNMTRYKDEMKRKVPPEERCAIEVVIADIKTGQARLSHEQRMIREAVLKKQVAWDEIRIGIPDAPPERSLEEYIEGPFD